MPAFLEDPHLEAAAADDDARAARPADDRGLVRRGRDDLPHVVVPAVKKDEHAADEHCHQCERSDRAAQSEITMNLLLRQ